MVYASASAGSNRPPSPPGRPPLASPQSGWAASDLNEEAFQRVFQEKGFDIGISKEKAKDFCGFASKIPHDNLQNEAMFQDFFLHELGRLSSIELVHEEQTKRRRISTSSRGSREGTSSGTENYSRKEAAIKNILNQYKSHLEATNVEETTKSWYEYPQDVRGGLIKKNSRPDIACINNQTGTLIVGELKNRCKYQRSDAIRQCATYMYHILWWFRVQQRRDVRQVDGFCVCGPKCREAKGMVVVSFLRLGVPEKIGGPLPLSCHHQIHEANSDETMISLRQLGVFLTRQHEGAQPNDALLIDFDFPVPGSMMLPLSFCKSQPKPWLRVVKSGTCALVLQITRSDELANVDVYSFMKENFGMTKVGFKVLNRSLEKFQNDESIYVKVVNPAAGSKWNDKDMFRSLLYLHGETVDRGLAAYEEKGYVVDRYFITIIMHGMGSPIGSQDLLEFAPFCFEFLGLMNRTEQMWNDFKAVHGDIHRHNVLFKIDAEEGKRLNLIDWDECTGETPMQRQVTQRHHKERYPECFQNDGLSFTRVQLLVLFRDLVLQEYGKIVYMDADKTITFVDEGSKGDGDKLVVGNQATPEHVTCWFEALKEALAQQAAGQG